MALEDDDRAGIGGGNGVELFEGSGGATSGVTETDRAAGFDVRDAAAEMDAEFRSQPTAGLMTRVFRYGIRPPKENAELVLQQMRKAHDYRNTLTQIERGRRAALRALYLTKVDLVADDAAATAALAAEEEAVKAIKKAKSETRSHTLTASLRKALQDAREARKTAVDKLRETRRKIREDAEIKLQTDAINDRAAELVRSAREHCGVYWGTYLLIEAAAQASRTQPLYDGTLPNDPRFLPWREEGAIGVQIQKGMRVNELENDLRLRIVVDPERRPRLADHPRWAQHDLERVAREKALEESNPAALERLSPAWQRRADRMGAPATHTSRFAWLRMRVGSEGRAPIWATFHMKVGANPIPADAIIKAATVHLRKHGPPKNKKRVTRTHELGRSFESWTVEITVEVPKKRREPAGPPRNATHPENSPAAYASAFGPPPKVREGAVAIDLGWRLINPATRDIPTADEVPTAELRVATWRGEDGRTGELRLPVRLLDGFGKVESLQKIRDDRFNDARAGLVAWRRKMMIIGLDPRVVSERIEAVLEQPAGPPLWGPTHPVTMRLHLLDVLSDEVLVKAFPAEAFAEAPSTILPAWFQKRVEHLDLWRSKSRLYNLVEEWADKRYSGDEAIFPALEAWAKKDKHLYIWQSDLHQTSIERRRAIYKSFARGLSEHFKTVVLEKLDLRDFARRAPAEAGAENEVARSNRHRAALSELVSALAGAFMGDEVKLPPANSTRDCHECNVTETFDAASKLMHTCRNGHTWDQDHNAAAVLLKRYLANPPKPAAPAVPKESKWARASRLRKEKAARKEAATKK